MSALNQQIMLAALNALDRHLDFECQLLMGGGGALALAHHFPLSTADIDAVPKGMDPQVLDPYIHKVAQELKLSSDWLNPYYSTFTHTLPPDYGTRLIEVFKGKQLQVLALGLNEMLIMKCFAHRPKDVGHARALIKAGAHVGDVGEYIEKLREKRIPGAQEALDFLDDIQN